MEPTIIAGFGHWDVSAKWQIVFRTPTGQDYCRETLPASMTLAEVNKWTLEQIEQYNKRANARMIGGAQINRF